jgi:hypothetical protein
MHLIVLLCDVDHLEAEFNMFGGSFNLGARKVHGLRLMYCRHGNCYGHSRWYSFVMCVNRRLVSVCFDIVLVLAQDRCMVCAERTIGLEIILDALDGIPR